MAVLDLDELAAAAADIDAAIVATPGIDHFCSACDWILPAAKALMPPRRPWSRRLDSGWMLLMAGQADEGWRYLQPLEASWGLSFPLAGPIDGASLETLVREAVAIWREHQDEWDVLLLGGVPLETPLGRLLLEHLDAHWVVRRGPSTRRHRASLEGGLDAFLERRARGLRKTVRQAERRSLIAGVELVSAHVEDPAQADATYARILAIEERSWKGKDGVGIDRGAMRNFYLHMNRRLVTRRAQRIWLARHQDRDVGYVLGGTLGDTYRGLQFSYDDDFADFSLGNLLQVAQVRELCAAGYREYDLGVDIPYKRRWGEITFDTVTLVVSR